MSIEDLGFIAVESLELGRLKDPNWLGLRIADQNRQLTLGLPVMNCAETVSAVLHAAGDLARGLPQEQLTAALERHLLGQLSTPIDVYGFMARPESGEILINLGYGVLCCKLQTDARDELKTAAGEL